MKKPVYLKVTDHKTELMPLVLGATLYFRLPLKTVLRSAVADLALRQQVLTEWRQLGWIKRNADDVLVFTEQITQAVMPSTAPTSTQLPSVLDIVRAFQRRSSNALAKVQNDAQMFARFRSFCQDYTPHYVLAQIDHFFTAAEAADEPQPTTVVAFGDWLHRHATEADRALRKSVVYAKAIRRKKSN